MTALFVSDVNFLRNARVFDEAYSKVCAERQAKIDAVKRKDDKILSLGAGLLLRKAFEKNGIEYEGTKFSCDEYGKPFAENRNVFFNLSHSRSNVACAVSDEKVGCDIEAVRDIDGNLAKRFFSDDEYKTLLSCRTKEEKSDTFFGIWTAKESFLKAVGTGIRVSLNSFSVPLGGGEVTQSVDNGKYYVFGSSRNRYKISVCSLYNEAPSVEYIDLSEEIVI